MEKDRPLPLQIRLRDGSVVPLDAYLVARDLEQRGVRLVADGGDVLLLAAPERVTDDDRRALRLYRSFILRILDQA